MSLEKSTVKQCCTDSPIWIFLYSDGSIFAICQKDFKDPAYQTGVIEVINLETEQSFKPSQIFGEITI